LAWAARVLAAIKPLEHIDVSSSVHFSTIVSAFFPTRFLDYRPAQIGLDNLSTDFADLTKLPFASDTILSLSCMHVVEHVGLGRYGDPLDPRGDLKAIRELRRVLAPGGHLLFVVPVGRPRIQFNAHRIYGFEQIATQFSDFVLEEFALIPDKESEGGLLRRASPSLVDRLQYGCGCFHYRKP
jgi:SAM-dependent methyltransferase